MKAIWLASIIAVLPGISAAEPPAPPDELATARTIRVLTQDADGDERSTKIWVAVVEGDVYIRTGDTRWFKNLERDASLTIVHDDKHYPATAVQVGDSERIDAVKVAFRQKHRIMDPMVALFRGGTNVFRLDAPTQP